MLSQTSEYALRAVVCLANASNGALTAHQIAALGKVPPGYMAKVLMALSRAGILHSRRGLRGGFTLARPAREMSVLDVLNAIEPVRRILACPLGLPAHGENLCSLHQRLDHVASQVEGSYASSTISGFLEGPDGKRPLCLQQPTPSAGADFQSARVVHLSDTIVAGPAIATERRPSVPRGAGHRGNRGEGGMRHEPR